MRSAILIGIAVLGFSCSDKTTSAVFLKSKLIFIISCLSAIFTTVFQVLGVALRKNG